ncbi:MAG TPA: DsbA family protein [bacterium]|nr:DsbA family protein [bacterium]
MTETAKNKKNDSSPEVRDDQPKQDQYVTISVETLILTTIVIILGITTLIYMFINFRSMREDLDLIMTALGIQKEKTYEQASTSIDDDAILGDKSKAEIAIVEFSDYECPYCKRHFEQVFPQIKSELIDTGKAIYVYRDNIVIPGHNPTATQEAIAAECSRNAGGDDMYYRFHEAIYQTTESNNTNMNDTQIAAIADELGVKSADYDACLTSQPAQDELDADIAAAAEAGLRGTPGFIVGKVQDDGSVEGYLISGAQPFDEFKEVIDKL